MRQAIQGMIFIDSSNLLITNPEESKVVITPTHIFKSNTSASHYTGSN